MSLDLRTTAERLAPDPAKHYLGRLCVRGHDAGDGQSWRHKKHRNCTICMRERTMEWKLTGDNRQRSNQTTARRDAVRGHLDRKRIWPFALHISSRRTAAKAKDIPFALTVDWAKLQWREQQGRCFWTQQPMDFFVGGDRHPLRPSLERLIPKRGYVPGNVVWATNFANRARGDLDAVEFAQLMRGFGFKLQLAPNFHPGDQAMKKILLVAAGAVALIGAAPAVAPAPPTFDEAMSICRTTLLDNPQRGKAMFDALKSEDVKRSVAILCLAYRQGALDVIEAANTKPEHLT